MDQRPKLYALRTTWDDVFEPRILYDLDIKVNISIFIMTTHDYDPKILLFILYESCLDQNYWLQLASEGKQNQGCPGQFVGRIQFWFSVGWR